MTQTVGRQTVPTSVPRTVPRQSPGPARTSSGLAAEAARAVQAAVAHLSRRQHADGWWKGELETNVTMDAEDLLLREFLGVRQPLETEEAARWIRSKQRDDGSWANFHGGPGDVSTSVEAWVSLRLAGDPPDAPHMAAAAAFVRSEGGVESSRVFTRIWLALFGLWAWDDLPQLPPELVLLPPWVPGNVYDWGCWARQTVVPLTVVRTLRPVRPVPFGVDELRAQAVDPGHRSGGPCGAVPPLFAVGDRLLATYARWGRNPLRRLAMRQAAEWVLARQEADGSWGGIQPPWVYSLIALHVLGYPLDHPAMRAGLAGLDGFTVHEVCENRKQGDHGRLRRLEACQSPVWDTALALTALRDAGVSPDDDRIVRAVDWVLGEEIRVTGDWSVRRPGLAPGGWAFEFANDNYPDTDDTAEVVLALRRCEGTDRERLSGAVERAVAWLEGMQSADGGWGAFDADNTRAAVRRLSFCDFGEVIDPPSADVTAHVVEMLAALGRADEPACRRGVAWLLASQEDDGSWFGRWGANYVYGTGAAVPALVAAGVPPNHRSVRDAVRWLEACQHAGGGWGEDLRSYRDRSWAGRGEPTASQTAWALLALLAAGERSPAVERGVRWLCDTQQADGGWDEPYFTGTGFPGYFFINYHLYRVVFPLSALGRYLSAAPPSAAGGGERA